MASLRTYGQHEDDELAAAAANAALSAAAVTAERGAYSRGSISRSAAAAAALSAPSSVGGGLVTRVPTTESRERDRQRACVSMVAIILGVITLVVVVFFFHTLNLSGGSQNLRRFDDHINDNDGSNTASQNASTQEASSSCIGTSECNHLLTTCHVAVCSDGQCVLYADSNGVECETTASEANGGGALKGTCTAGRCVAVAETQSSTEQKPLESASLSVETCGCPARFADEHPTCERRWHWEVKKTISSNSALLNPVSQPYSFDVDVRRADATANVLVGSGVFSVSNAGDHVPTLESLVGVLEQRTINVDTGAQVWQRRGVARIGPNEPYPACKRATIVCENGQAESYEATEGARLGAHIDNGGGGDDDKKSIVGNEVRVEATLDNDGDGRRDEDPRIVRGALTSQCYDVADNDGDGQIDEDPLDGVDNDGDGAVDEDGPNDDFDCSNGERALPVGNCHEIYRHGVEQRIDEDGACEDSLHLHFSYEFPLDRSYDEAHSTQEWRVRLAATFRGGEWRQGVCSVDVDCDGVLDQNVETIEIEQRFLHGVARCVERCASVNVYGGGTQSDSRRCVHVETLNNEVERKRVLHASESFSVEGLVSCNEQRKAASCSATLLDTTRIAGDECAHLIEDTSSDEIYVACNKAVVEAGVQENSNNNISSFEGAIVYEGGDDGNDRQ